MRWRYHELSGKAIRTRDGHHVGRVSDLLAQRRGNNLRVTGLLTGQGALIRRIAFKGIAREIPARRIPWHMIDRIEDKIYLTVDLEVLDALNAQADPETAQQHTKEGS